MIFGLRPGGHPRINALMSHPDTQNHERERAMTKRFNLEVDLDVEVGELGPLFKSILEDETELTVNITEETDVPVYNELPVPFAQEWANLHDKIENLIVRALAAGVEPKMLYGILGTDVDQLIWNHS